MVANNPHTTYVHPAPSGSAVSVEPAVPGVDFDATYIDYCSARSFAPEVKLHRGFEIVDDTREGANG